MQNNLVDHLQKNGKIDIILLKQLLSQDKQLPLSWVKKLIKDFTKVVTQQPNIIKLAEPITIVGDIHGQYFDLLKIFSLLPNLQSPQDNILFLGDYVDRGPQGVEVILLLMAFKLTHPKQVFMIRGNHQSRQMTQIMNFYGECLNKYNQDVYFDIMDAFDALPLVCIVNEIYFCVHGGITSLGQTIEDIQKINRFMEVPTEGSLCDLLWADPIQDDNGIVQGGQKHIKNFQRNCSIFFGQQHTRRFLKTNRLMTIIRAHQVQPDGYKQHIWPNWKNIPMVYTIFSAPNYCGNYGNLGAILSIKNNKFHVRQFNFANPKYYVPEKYNAFNFTLPKLFDYLDHIMKKMSVKWVAKYMKQYPECKQLSGQDIIKLILNTQKLQKIMQNEASSSQVKSQTSKGQVQLDSSALFRRSHDYFSASQKRPGSLTYIPKQK